MTSEPVVKKPFSFLDWIRRGTKTRLLSGVFIVVPLVMTFYILRFLYSFTAGLLAPFIERLFVTTSPETPTPYVVSYAIATISVGVFLGLLYLVGMITTDVVGRRLIGLAEAIIRRIPFIKTIYSASKQVVDTISFREGSSSFKSVVLVEFPYSELLTVGFVTGRLTNGSYKVFVPTAPNITVGFLQFCPPEMVRNCDLSIEDAIKIVVSGGLICPECICISPGEISDEIPDESPIANTPITSD